MTEPGDTSDLRVHLDAPLPTELAVGGGSALFVGSRPDNGVVLGGYAVVDLRVAWQPRTQWQFEARLANALDRTVEPVRDYRGLGRQAWIGVRYASTGL